MAASLQLLSRAGCHLCEEAEGLLRGLGFDFATIDINTDADLVRRYGESIPVLLADGVEIARAPIGRESLRTALAGVERRRTEPDRAG